MLPPSPNHLSILHRKRERTPLPIAKSQISCLKSATSNCAWRWKKCVPISSLYSYRYKETELLSFFLDSCLNILPYLTHHILCLLSFFNFLSVFSNSVVCGSAGIWIRVLKFASLWILIQTLSRRNQYYYQFWLNGITIFIIISSLKNIFEKTTSK